MFFYHEWKEIETSKIVINERRMGKTEKKERKRARKIKIKDACFKDQIQ